MSSIRNFFCRGKTSLVARSEERRLNLQAGRLATKRKVHRHTKDFVYEQTKALCLLFSFQLYNSKMD